VKPNTNSGVGKKDEINGWFRYGSRHNDLCERISDLIRYKLKLKLSPRTQKKSLSLKTKKADLNSKVIPENITL
jgi:hypothetical protein